MKVAIVVMPFLAIDHPSLAAGLLKAAVEQRGISCDCKYFNITFAKMVGVRTYSDILDAPFTVLAGEWIFSQLYYGQSFSDWTKYEREVLKCPVWGLDVEIRTDFISTALNLAPFFLRVVFESNNWEQYDLIAFTSTFEQTMPSLCLARMIRKHYPQIKICAGGANFESSMGMAYMEHFSFLDYLCTGEGDECFPQLCENLSKGLKDVPPGILYRAGDQVQSTQANGRAFVELDSLPTPAFDDYFRVFSACFPKCTAAPVLVMETSRGCWWGERSHCTFCGLNGDGMKFRRKHWRRVVEEVDGLTRRYPESPVQFTDNILSLEYFKNLIPYWADNRDSTRKFFEVKSNLTRDQIEMLKRAGVVAVQAGVENLADDTLRLMRKGVTGAQNVALLRWSAELKLDVYWNVLLGFPNEPVADYDLNLSLMKLITHLRPPDFCGHIRMDRFSPNFTNWQSLGFSAIRPLPAYKHIFPLDEMELGRFAYYFAYDHPEFDRVLQLAKPLAELARRWQEKQKAGENGSLAVLPHLGGGFVLVDTRFNFERSKTALDPIEFDLLLQCDGPIGPHRAVLNTATTCNSTIEETQAVFDILVSRGVIAVTGRQAITLALLPEEARLQQAAESKQIQCTRSEEQWPRLNIL
ncbi:MAG TPA: RiPP maturation radical SAM C-methyltransferase [Silvibacterium sp.]|jgi:ribosomal peptide maturation radical SAM protein 1|nr:RiPP maturation radical SAM C-methyltransferase [Silvibacterium sp.]